MKHEYSEEQQMIRDNTRRFARERLRPDLETRDQEGAIAAAAFSELLEMGYGGMLLPEAAGGMELDPLSFLLAVEELAREEASVALLLVSQVVWGSRLLWKSSPEEQRRRFTASLEKGKILAPLLDISRNSLEKVGDKLLLRGGQNAVPGGAVSELLLVRARENDGPEYLLLLSATTPGIIREERRDMLGMRTAAFARIAFRDVEVPGSAVLIQGPGVGAAVENVLPLFNLALASVALGLLERTLAEAAVYAGTRVQFGRPIIEFQAIRHKLALMERDRRAARLLLEAGAEDTTPASAAAARLFCCTAATEHTREGVQVFGGYGYTKDYPVERFMRDAGFLEVWITSLEELTDLLAGRVADAYGSGS